MDFLILGPETEEYIKQKVCVGLWKKFDVNDPIHEK